jgi:hypothetical protein
MSTAKINVEFKVTDNFSGAVDAVLIEQNNKLLAIFTGGEDRGKIVGGCDTVAWYLRTENGVKIYKELFYSQLAYNSDWNWLMEIVLKIESIDNERFCFDISLSGATIEDMLNDFNTIVEIVGKTKIESVYLACVEFVKWYNKQNIKSC